MNYVLLTQDFFRETAVIGWWGLSPVALTGGVLFWNFLSFLIVLGQKHSFGNLFTGPRQKRLFLIGAGGTMGIQLLIYIFIGWGFLIFSSFLKYGFPVIYFLTLTLLLIAAVHFFILLISFIVGRFKIAHS